MVSPFETVDLVAWTRGESEPGGDEEKRWFIAPEDSHYEGHWLFKPRTEKRLVLSNQRRARGDEPDFFVGGEDWAEKIVWELATLIGVPAARTELASVIRYHDGRKAVGSMSLDMRPDSRSRSWTWTPGAALLAEYDDDFDADTCDGHTIEAIQRALGGLRGPVGSAYSDWEAFDVFAGYLALDGSQTLIDMLTTGAYCRTRYRARCVSDRVSITGRRWPAARVRGLEQRDRPVVRLGSGARRGERSASTEDAREAC